MEKECFFWSMAVGVYNRIVHPLERPGPDLEFLFYIILTEKGPNLYSNSLLVKFSRLALVQNIVLAIKPNDCYHKDQVLYWIGFSSSQIKNLM